MSAIYASPSKEDDDIPSLKLFGLSPSSLKLVSAFGLPRIEETLHLFEIIGIRLKSERNRLVRHQDGAPFLELLSSSRKDHTALIDLLRDRLNFRSSRNIADALGLTLSDSRGELVIYRLLSLSEDELNKRLDAILTSDCVNSFPLLICDLPKWNTFNELRTSELKELLNKVALFRSLPMNL